MGYTLIYLILSCCLRLQEVPILCYHNISNGKDGKEDLLHISDKQLNEQLRYLHEDGYATITPDELYAYMNGSAPLPSKPVMITFDDSHEAHFTIAIPVLNKYHYKGVFFIMTVCLNKPGWLTDKEIREMSAQGHIIACHTWDHTNLALHPNYHLNEQLIQPKKQLEKITGKTISYFAYPYGVWSEKAIKDLKETDYIAAFQLDKPQYSTDPNYTIRRIMVSGKWSGAELKKAMTNAFTLPY